MPHLFEGARDGLEDSARIGIDSFEGLLHETEEVAAHPRHAGELGAVRHFVQRDPEAEVAGRKAKRFSSARMFGPT